MSAKSSRAAEHWQLQSRVIDHMTPRHQHRDDGTDDDDGHGVGFFAAAAVDLRAAAGTNARAEGLRGAAAAAAAGAAPSMVELPLAPAGAMPAELLALLADVEVAAVAGDAAP